MDPLDAAVLRGVSEVAGGTISGQHRNEMASQLNASRDEIDISVANLEKLGLLLAFITPNVRTYGVRSRISAHRFGLGNNMARNPRRTYLPRIVGDKVMMPADLKRLHKYVLDVEHIGIISDEMREVVKELWPELAHKLPPKKSQG
jgi:hypothetical protein